MTFAILGNEVSSISGPRAVLTMYAVGFSSFNRRADSR